jgi:hypothetical protein
LSRQELGLLRGMTPARARQPATAWSVGDRVRRRSPRPGCSNRHWKSARWYATALSLRDGSDVQPVEASATPSTSAPTIPFLVFMKGVYRHASGMARRLAITPYFFIFTVEKS